MMGSMFGHKWVSSYGASVDPDKVWAATLNGLTPEQIKDGLKRLSDSGAEWPPSAPEFRKLCTDTGEHWEHKAQRIHFENTKKMLEAPKPKITKSVGEQHLNALKNKLAKG